ncbi:Heat shock protein DnaJ N-terminal [Penicillium frequentans]|uniref:Heat shock protein DnaJ N-terminal n=1 Tax=Penicillium frequentans TaxID=3151616 RepID=A0AAD6CJR4_9EURO|nr:Heat shock protein DnaJ N-terminal [Penicillium glabrum]
MVKADVRRDYYADLGLAPSAESEEIKKQFRKLALKFHPDRNPGREQEFIAKFQSIQAAHEILSDPQQRLKYDTDRLRAGYDHVNPHGPSSPRASRAQTQRPAYDQWPNASTTPNASAGAQRYSAHARANPQQWTRGQDDAQTRADAYKGFSGMRGGSTAGASWRGFDPQTGRTSAGSTTAGASRQQNTPFGTGTPRPKSAYEYFKETHKAQNNTSPNSGRKKQGFAPGTAGGGDEPPARNTSAYTHNRSERPSSIYFDSVPPPTAKKPPPAPEPPQFTEEFERNRRGYASTGGEKTFFSSTPLGRPASTRPPSGSFRSPNPPSPVYPPADGRHHSASPKPRRRASYSPSPSTSSSGDSLESQDEWEEVVSKRNGKPKAVPKSRLPPHQKFSDFYRKADSNPGTGEEPSTRPGGHRYEDPRAPNNEPRRPRRVAGFGDLTADSDDNKGHNSDSAAFTRGSSRPQQPSQSTGSTSRTESAQSASNPATAAFGRRSTSDVNSLHKKFSAEDWRDHIEGFDFLGASASKLNAARKSPNSKPRGRAKPQYDSTDSVPSTGSAGLNTFGSVPEEESQQNAQKAPTPFAQAKFSADQWAEQLRNLSWDVPESDKQRQSAHTPPRSPRKQSRTGTKVRSAPQAASVASEADEAKDTINGTSVPGEVPNTEEAGGKTWAAPDVEAMDIDMESPPMPKKTPAGGAKNAGYPDLNNVAQEATATNAKAQQPKADGSASNTETRTPLFDLENLRNTAPFTSTNSGGIENLDDVHATLPFESRAKQQTTTKRDIRPRELKLPNPPKRPWAPQTVALSPGITVLPLEKWQYYVSQMGTYMHDWNVFNRKILSHFNARQEAVETGLSSNWISAVGDSTRLKLNEDDEADESSETRTADTFDLEETLVPGSGKGGFSAYLRGIEEDVQVRKHWEVACEMHRECILDLGRLREWIRNGGKVVSFSTI